MNQPVLPAAVMAAAPANATSFHPSYRPDIDGLRAVAVLCVVIFHAFPSLLQGGFIGVDIFFVISGFLITSIIIGSLERGTFTFADFYGRRVRRIFPVLLLVLAASYVFGWFALLAPEYKQLGKHMAGGAGFVSNFMLWGESGYFDNAASSKPLLHLWSLGVEEQFYIVWPALLWLAFRRGYKLFSLIVLVAVLSFLFNLAMLHTDGTGAFYAPQSRFWQLLAGAMLAWMSLHGKGKDLSAFWRNAQSLLGAALIAAGLLVIREGRAFPGWWAMLPTLGAALLISAGGQAWLNRKLLAQPLLVQIGLISFPLYLWHWPLLVFARIAERDQPSAGVRAGLVVAALVLAWLSYRLLERPLRSGGKQRIKTMVLLALMVAIAALGYNTWRRDGLSFRFKDRAAYAAYFQNDQTTWGYFLRVGIPQKYHHECQFFDIEKYRAGHMTGVPRKSIAASCYQRDLSRAKAVMLWGDSHVEHLSYGIRQHLPPEWQVLQVASSGCNPSLLATAPSATDQCTQSNWFALKTIAEAHPDVVVVGQNLGHTQDNFAKIAARLKQLGVQRVVFTGPDPHWTDELPKLMMTDLWLAKPRRTFHGVEREVVEYNVKLKRDFPASDPNVVFVSLMDFFCNQEGCMTYLGNDPMTGLVSYDYGHMTPVASDLVGKQLLARVITGAAPP